MRILLAAIALTLTACGSDQLTEMKFEETSGNMCITSDGKPPASGEWAEYKGKAYVPCDEDLIYD